MTYPLSRRSLRLGALITVALAVAARLEAQPLQPSARQGSVGRLAADLEQYVEKALRDWGVPGIAVAVVRNDSVLAVQGFGVREIGKPERVDAHTVFDAASITKSFTATAIAMLVDSGKMDWDVPVTRYIPELELPDPYLTHHATVRDFLSHRTGLQPGNFVFRFTEYTRPELLYRLRYFEQQRPFRTELIYSNIGYMVAGEASGRAAGMSWEALIRKRILDPMGLRDTRLWSEGNPSSPGNVARPHAIIGNKQQVLPGGDFRVTTGPAGAVQSSAWDLAQWMRFHLARGVLNGKRFVSEASLSQTHAPQIVVPTTAAFRTARQLFFHASYGMGWQVWDYRGHPMLWHTGSGNGQIAYMAILPSDNLGVVVLVNSWRAPILHGILAGRIIDTYLGLPSRDGSAEGLLADSAAQVRAAEALKQYYAGQIRNTKPSRPLDQYAGIYSDSVYGNIAVKHDAGRLTLQMGRGEIADLRHWHFDTFLVEWRTPLFREVFTTRAAFSLDVDGKPNAFTMRLNRDTVAVRRKPS